MLLFLVVGGGGIFYFSCNHLFFKGCVALNRGFFCKSQNTTSMRALDFILWTRDVLLRNKELFQPVRLTVRLIRKWIVWLLELIERVQLRYFFLMFSSCVFTESISWLFITHQKTLQLIQNAVLISKCALNKSSSICLLFYLDRFFFVGYILIRPTP